MRYRKRRIVRDYRCGKVRYRDQSEGLIAMRVLRKHSVRDDVPSHVYWCPVCKGWHLTKAKDRE